MSNTQTRTSAMYEVALKRFELRKYPAKSLESRLLHNEILGLLEQIDKFSD